MEGSEGLFEESGWRFMYHGVYNIILYSILIYIVVIMLICVFWLLSGYFHVFENFSCGVPRNVSTPPMGTLQNSGVRDRRHGASMSKATALNGWSCANKTVV